MAKQSIKTFLIKLIAAEFLFMSSVMVGYYFFFFNIVIDQQLVYPANYGEQLAREVAEEFKAGQAQLEQLPDFVEYALLDADDRVIQTTITQEKEIEKIINNHDVYRSGGHQGRYVAGDKQNLIVMYRLRSEFQSPWLRRYLPPAEPFFLVLLLILLASGFLVLLSYFAKVINRELAVVVSVNDSILAEDMSHERKKSSLKEVQAILTSLYNMEDALKESLQKEWQQQRQSEASLRALTHDIKTPIALVSGNLELIAETAVTVEQQLYLDYAQKGIERIDNYVSELRELPDQQVKVQELVPFNPAFIEDLLDLVAQHGIIKNVDYRVICKETCPQLQVDKVEFSKVFQNVLENAIRYSAVNSQLTVAFIKEEGRYSVVVTDQGPGFSPAALVHGKELFFTENKGREATHSGLGLTIADHIMTKQGGELTLENALSAGEIIGGRVILAWELRQTS